MTMDWTTTEAPSRYAPGRLALFMTSLAGGGVERVMLNLAGAFAIRGYRVDLLLCQVEGPYRDQIPPGVNVIGLEGGPGWLARVYALAADPQGFVTLLRPVLLPVHTPKKLRYLPSLVHYLRRERPQVLLSAMTNTNLVALWACRLAGVPTRGVISEHITLSQSIHVSRKGRTWRRRFLPPLIKRTYAWADTIIAVSNGVAEDLSRCAGVPRERITTIYNPIVSPLVDSQSQAPLDHPWFQPSAPPVVLGIGRLHEQKDFPTLLRAFVRVRAQRKARLMILGEADAKSAHLRTELMALAARLGVADDVALPGFVTNPFAYLARAAVFALSSAWEGLPSVLIEALACGCPVVSTDCPSGPVEILENGKYGPLVPVGNDVALADAILSVLDTPPDRDWLRARGAMFRVDDVVDRYLEVLLNRENRA
jgi:glycosyltransferase involved in cell wall biosynthesis